MTISSTEQEVKKVSIAVDRNPVSTSFEKWAQPGHFSRTLAKGPKTTTWIWNLHADAHDFDSHTSSLEDISRKIFSAHFGQLSIIFLWLSGIQVNASEKTLLHRPHPAGRPALLKAPSSSQLPRGLFLRTAWRFR